MLATSGSSPSLFRTKNDEDPWQLRSFKRHNSDWLKTSLPFVCKVIRHIHDLEEKTEVWFRQFTESLQSESQGKSQSSEKLSGISQRKEFNQTNFSSDLTSSNLCISSIGFNETEPNQTTALYEETREVLSEIIGLMEQLEAECKKTNEALQTERERVTTLGNRIDQLSLWWMRELPEAVQKEYAVHSEEIYELELHAKCKASHLQKVQIQVNDARILNQKLREEINSVKKLEDHLKEMLDLEKKTIDDIVPNQKELTDVFSEVISDLNKVQQEFDDATAEAQLEQNEMYTEILSIEDKTSQLNKDIITAKTVFEIYTTQEQKIQDQIVEAEKSQKRLTDELVDLEFQKNIEKDNIQQLKAKVADKYVEIKMLTAACTEIEHTIRDKMQNGNADLSNQQKEYDKKLDELKNLETKNEELELDIETFNNNIKDSRQERNKMKRELQQIQEALKINNDKLASMKKQLSQVEKVLNALRTKLATLRKTISDEEGKLKNQIGKVKRKIRDEMTQRNKLQAKVKLDAAALTELKENTNNKKRRALNKVSQVEKTVEKIEREFKELEAIYKNHYEIFLMLNKKLNELKESQQSMSEDLENEKKDLQNKLINDQKEFLDSFNLLNSSLEQIETLQKNIPLKQTLRSTLLKDIEKYKKSIEDMKPTLDLTEFKHNSATNLTTSLKSELAIAKRRWALMEEEYQKLLQEKREEQKKVTTKLASALMENAIRTVEYKQLQGTYLDTKSKLADIYYDKLKTEGRIKDYLQLSALQTRMHKALVDYSRQRGLYSQAELATFQAFSLENAQKIIAVQVPQQMSFRGPIFIILTGGDVKIHSAYVCFPTLFDRCL
ncbi:coiled-coil domain-containing protein 178 isoform X3 [Hypanus sabinus]|uniref:coiled-coil domain-containing protein 178 isoform X3 n=1 Tax=Hypanus sabinus TaxID=79690 RepID=UPI0028C482E1|nr:coiled-coil domain-containing protein 178 isoform X3 [Hypanus sabinus]